MKLDERFSFTTANKRAAHRGCLHTMIAVVYTGCTLLDDSSSRLPAFEQLSQRDVVSFFLFNLHSKQPTLPFL